MKSGAVAIIGRPNSGKSTLLNAFVGQKVSIVSDKPQTTRHRILGIHTEAAGQIVFVDTPGVHKPKYRMNERMLRRVYDSLAEVDLALLVVDGSIAFGSGEAFVLELVRNSARPTILLINKIDIIAKPKLLPVMKRYAEQYEFLEIIPVSALTGENLALVKDKILQHLPEGDLLFSAEQFTDRTERFLTAELIREKLLAVVREELPYASAVLVRQFDESRRDADNLVVIHADIVVEKKSQQGIIVGAGAARLRDLGTAARRAVEELLGCRVYLNLEVRTIPNWRDSEVVLNELDLEQ
jgi:GTP-binding protein Era